MAAKSSPKGFDGKMRSVNGIFLLARQYEARGIHFTLTGINGAYKLEMTGKDGVVERYFSRYKTALTPKDLGFVRKVKNYVEKSQIAVKFCHQLLTTEDIKYIDMQRFEDGTEFDDVYEIDIDQAYWKTAKMLDIISEKIFEEGSKYNIEPGLSEVDIKRRKMVRLIALGSLAKKTKTYRFKGKKIILLPETKTDKAKQTENVWYTICKRVSDCMQEAKKAVNPSDYVMYWVDGIYVRGEHNVKAIQEVFLKWGYESKIKKIHRVHYENAVCHALEKFDDEKPRTFHLSNPNKKQKRLKTSLEKINATILKYSK